jgi:hypothetical protein
MADSYISKLHVDIRSLQFAPSTIAIAALLLTFSKLEISCSEWVQALPDLCLPPRKGTRHALLGSSLESYLDVDRCLQVFQSLNVFDSKDSPRRRRARVSSPVRSDPDAYKMNNDNAVSAAV